MLPAVAGCTLASVAYVGLLHIRPTGLSRDHPKTIRQRTLGIAVACCLAWLPLWFMLQHFRPPITQTYQPKTLTAALGLRTDRCAVAVKYPVLLTLVFFMGPALHSIMTFMPKLGYLPSRAWAGLSDLRNWRNLVIGPVSEEFVFRACMVPLLRLQGMSSLACAFAAPLFFGAAHLHHLHDLTQHQRVPWRNALIMVTIQFTYTTVFGWYATWLFLRSGHLLAPIAAHVVANAFGFPAFSDMARHRHATLLAAATVAGVCAFAALLPSLTRPALYA